ncbi:MAG: Mur ligase family protein, partial [Burkholderiaceae bacterium]|nr:Mur ligase family protein [Burkholderiaceae bacterium]
AFLDAILRAAGYRVGLYTSPHLLRFNERARIGGVPAADAELIAQFEAVERARGGTTLTYFEFTTLAILRLFAHGGLDAAVLEIGLGGRLDAVNIVDADCAVLTTVDIDHVEYLGPTREAIGFEKAHIFRAQRPAIVSDPQPPASVLDVARVCSADLWLRGRDFDGHGDRQQWSYVGRAVRRSGLPYPALRGASQLLNASAALAALEAVAPRLPVSQQAVRTGLLTAELAARFQVLPGRPTVILDVAHNPQAAAELARNLDRQGFFPRTHAVFGMLRDKDVRAVVERVAPAVDVWHVGPTHGARGASAEELSAIVRAVTASAEVHTYPNVAAALAAAREASGVDDRIVVFGSFLTVAEAMRANGDSTPAR